MFSLYSLHNEQHVNCVVCIRSIGILTSAHNHISIILIYMLYYHIDYPSQISAQFQCGILFMSSIHFIVFV